jgi:UDP-glucose 4-epimerase
MRYAVTGGAGFIGSHLADLLIELEHQVVVVDNLSSGKAENIPKQASFAHTDIVTQREFLPVAFEGCDGVFHLAARPRVQVSIADPLGTAQVNVNGTFTVLEAAQRAGVKRVVYASSSSVYGNPKFLPVGEVASLSPLSPYAAQKAAGEAICRVFSDPLTYGMSTACLRFFNVYGPRFDPNGPYALVIGKFINQRKNHEPLTICGDGEQARDFTHVSDVVRACWQAMRTMGSNWQGMPINIGAGNPVTINRIAELIGGPAYPREYLPERLGEPRRTHAEIALAWYLLGWRPSVSIEEGIASLKREMHVPPVGLI